MPSDVQEEIRKLKREDAELRRTNGILKMASAFFTGELYHPHDEMTAYIHMLRDRFGVEFICCVIGRQPVCSSRPEDIVLPRHDLPAHWLCGMRC